MKTGIIGGTFDPIHNGHISIARAALHEYGLDSMWLMPAGDPYFKSGSSVSDPVDRLRMTELAASTYPDELKCTDFEIKQTGHTYSADTFAALRKMYPDEEFYFVIGLDSLRSLHKWYKPDVLFQNAVILCALRGETDGKDTDDIHHCNENESSPYEFAARELDAANEAADMLRAGFSAVSPDIRLIHTPLIDISSTMIREAVRAGKDISRFVPDKVADYIHAHRLYL